MTAAGANLEDRRSVNMSSILLPVCVMQSVSDVEHTADHILDKLMAAGGSGLSSLYSTITETFVELANNGVEHSQSEIGTLGLVELRMGKKTGSFEIAVGDGGLGIRQTLRGTAGLDKKRRESDWSLIEYATGELVSGTGDPHRGIGLFGVAEDSRMPGAVLRLQSGHGGLHINQSSEIRATRDRLFPGTLAYVSIRFPVI